MQRDLPLSLQKVRQEAENHLSLKMQEELPSNLECLNDCSGRGSCMLGTCICQPHFGGDDCSREIVPCPFDCSGHGLCQNISGIPRCNCIEGFGGEDCSEIRVSCPNMCSEHGECSISHGGCVCQGGYGGIDCGLEITSCGTEEDCMGPSDCVDGLCECLNGMWGSTCSQECEDRCSEKGICVEGECFCDYGWTGSSCTERQKSVSVDHRLPSNETHVVTEIWVPWRQKLQTFQQHLWPSLKFKIMAALQINESVASYENSVILIRMSAQTQKIPFHASKQTGKYKPKSGVSVVFAIPSKVKEFHQTLAILKPTHSSESHLDVVENIQLSSLSGLSLTGVKSGEVELLAVRVVNQNPCLDNCNFHGDCVKNVCVCDDGWFGESCFTKNECDGGCPEPMVCNNSTQKCRCPEGYTGATCEIKLCSPQNCSGHGTCNNGVCECVHPWTSEDCSVESLCQGNPICSAHGDCMPTSVGGEPKLICVCQKDYHGIDCHAYLPCLRDCSNNGYCDRGVCFCNRGFSGDDCSEVVQCPHNCSAHGDCDAGVCKCHTGFSGYDCSRKLSSCPQHCSGIGNCIDGVCECPPNFTGDDCSIPTTNSSCYLNCSGHGSCSGGYCVCRPGWTGIFCAQEDLPCPNACSGMGICNGKRECECFEGRTGVDCSQVTQSYEEQICAHNCSGKGVCTWGSCVCISGFTGSDCSKSVDDCPFSCSGKGKCVGSKCQCESGFSGNGCQQPKLASYDCSKNCTGHGTCVGRVCVCYGGFTGTDCSVELSCPNNCSGRGLCLAGQCVCQRGYGGSDECDGSANAPTDCSKSIPICPHECSGYGKCNDNGICECQEGYTGVDCSHSLQCPFNCSGHGFCIGGHCKCDYGFGGPACSLPLGGCATECPINTRCNDSICVCDHGWTGSNCSIKVSKSEGCPTSNPLLRCSGNGICVNGSCVCDKGWFGDSCVFQCPSNCSNTECDLHGICVNGSCHCIEGWGGSDCSTAFLGSLYPVVKTFTEVPSSSPTNPFQILQQQSADITSVPSTNTTPEVSNDSQDFDQEDTSDTDMILRRLPEFTEPNLVNTPKSSQQENEIIPIIPVSQVPLCTNNCSNNGECIQGKCYCDISKGFIGSDCSENAKICPNSCSGNGYCNFKTGVCECIRTFSGDDCSKGPINSNPCALNCSGSGICEHGHCSCNRATSGKSCQVFCPNGCSGNGVCAHGSCFCSSHYQGDDCSEYHGSNIIPPSLNAKPIRPHQSLVVESFNNNDKKNIIKTNLNTDTVKIDGSDKVLVSAFEQLLKQQEQKQQQQQQQEQTIEMVEVEEGVSNNENQNNNEEEENVFSKMLKQALIADGIKIDA